MITLIMSLKKALYFSTLYFDKFKEQKIEKILYLEMR